MATHSIESIGYYLYLFMQTQFQLGRYLHQCMYKWNTFSCTFNPYFVRHNYRRHKLAKVQNKFCRFTRECILLMHANCPAGIVFAWTETNSRQWYYRVGNLLARYLFPYFLFWSLLPFKFLFLVCLFLLYNRTPFICTETWNLVFIKTQYACATPTFVTEVLHSCTAVA